MKLFELLEQENPLSPGEKRAMPSLGMRDLQRIQTKIEELQSAFNKSILLKGTFEKDIVLKNALENLQKRIQLKISYLEKMKHRPSRHVERMVAILNRECSEFIEILKRNQKFLYRGIRSSDSVFQGRSREDRQPKDSRTAISNRLDDALKAQGFVALRSNSIFTTTDFHFAASYGNVVYLIFPKNGFHFLTTNTKDLVLNSWEKMIDDEALYQFADKLNTWGEANVPDWADTRLASLIKYEYHESLIRELEDEFNWRDNPLKLPDEFNVKFEDFVTDEGIINKLEPTQTNIDESMREGREILIHGEYWALKTSDWEDPLAKIYLSSEKPLEPQSQDPLTKIEWDPDD